MLYIYAKLNPSISYFSGMNEIIANIYFTFYNDTVPDQRQYAESDTFFCFNALILKNVKTNLLLLSREFIFVDPVRLLINVELN